MLDIRKPPGHMDAAATYVALSRATCLENIYLLFPVTLRDLNRPRNKDVVALIEFLQRLEQATLAAFKSDPSNFTASTASLPLDSDNEDVHDDSTTNSNSAVRRGLRGNRSSTRQRTAATSLTAHLMPNLQNNCFFNSAIALCLGTFDGQPLPASCDCTPAGAAFFAALQLIRDAMFHTNPLQNTSW